MPRQHTDGAAADAAGPIAAGIQGMRRNPRPRVRCSVSMRNPIPAATLIAILLAFGSIAQAENSTFNVRSYGATGDGKTLDTAALNKAVAACAEAGGGQVLVPAGAYLSATVHLKSKVTLKLDAGARIIGASDLAQYAWPTQFPDPWHRALILGDGVENVAIVGPGVIDGNKVPDPDGEEHMRGPHAVLFANSHHIAIRDVCIQDAGNYAVLLRVASQVEVRGVKITGGWDGVHFRGRKDEPCRDVSITDCEFYTGDDCIAGFYWQDTLIDHCIINSSCNGIRLIGPAQGLIIHDCLIFGPGRHEHRTSREKHRTNMLAGLCLQPGAWEQTQGAMDDVKISDITMYDVTTPLHLSLKAGNVAGRITIDRLTATGAYLAAASIESWAEAPIDHVTLRDVSLQFTGGAAPRQGKVQVKAPGVDARPLPSWGLYAKNIRTLDLENVRLGVDKPDGRPAILAEGVASLTLDTVRLPLGPASATLALSEVLDVRRRDSGIETVAAKCVSLQAGVEPCSVVATVQNPGSNPGLSRIDLSVDGQTSCRWVWLAPGAQTQVVFLGLAPGKHEVRCGEVQMNAPAAEAETPPAPPQLAKARFVVPPVVFLHHTAERSFIGPGMFQLENGELLMAAPWGRPPTHFEQLAAKYPVPLLYRSRNGGRSWAEQGRLNMPWSLTGMISDGGVSFLRLKDGRLAFVANRHVQGLHGGGLPVISFSCDDGKTWTPARLIGQPEGVWYVMNDRLIQLRDGRLLVPVAHMATEPGRSEGQKNLSECFMSDDAGLTWTLSRTPAQLDDERGMAEPAVAELADGRVLMLARTGRGFLYASWSDDRGQTWSQPQPTVLMSACSSLTLKTLPDGRLIVFYDHVRPLGKSAFFPRSPLCYAVSSDGGKSWSQPVIVDDEGADKRDRQNIYPSILFTKEGMLVMWSTHPADPKGSFAGSYDASIGGGKRAILAYP